MFQFSCAITDAFAEHIINPEPYQPMLVDGVVDQHRKYIECTRAWLAKLAYWYRYELPLRLRCTQIPL